MMVGFGSISSGAQVKCGKFSGMSYCSYFKTWQSIETQHVKSWLQNNGYRCRNIQKVIKRHIQPSPADRSQDPEISKDTAYLPFIHGVTERFGRILGKPNIKVLRKLLTSLFSEGSSSDPML
ncbi:hypothetical protein Trydic_g805 [Trypoxylus dichotomus]